MDRPPPEAKSIMQLCTGLDVRLKSKGEPNPVEAPKGKQVTELQHWYPDVFLVGVTMPTSQ